MPNVFNQQDIRIITEDLKVLLNAERGQINKLDYFSTLMPQLETAGTMELDYQNENIDIIPEIENAVIKKLMLAEKKEIGIQLQLCPTSFMVQADRIFLQQIFLGLLSRLLESIENKSVVRIYVTDSDGKCIIEAISQAEAIKEKEEDNYFKKYRITNPLHASIIKEEAVLYVYKKIVEDMGGELTFSNDKQHFFRLKFPIA